MTSQSSPERADQPSHRQMLIVIAIALTLMLAWTIRDHAALAALYLPDTDDMMRLAQVRDWLAGQSFADLTQHRVAPPFGGSMHWSRLGDIGIALPIVLLTPLIGATAAEQTAVLLYPAVLFILYLLLIARIAARLIGRDGVIGAAILGAIAFPALTLMFPGRIDHHGLQTVLMLVMLEALVARASWKSGLAAGAATALSLGVGLETAPQMLSAMAVLFAFWVWRADEAPRTTGFGMAMLIFTAALLPLHPDIWSERWCDGFSPSSVRATLIAGGLWVVLGLSTRRLETVWRRIGAGVPLGVVCVGLALWTSPVCLSGPYGAVDPLLMRLWISQIGEVKGLLAQPWDGMFLFGGLTLAATIAVLALLVVTRADRWRWLPVAALLLASAVCLFAQGRAGYIGSAFAALPFAWWLNHARARLAGKAMLVPALAGLWLSGAGLTYVFLAGAVDAPPAAKTANGGSTASCPSAAQMRQLDRLPTGLVIAPVDMGASIIGMTRHMSLSAPYHRNDWGNRAMYAFFLSSPKEARAIARQWRASYVAFCANSFAEVRLEDEGPGGTAQLLRADKPPRWLRPLFQTDDGLTVYRIAD